MKLLIYSHFFAPSVGGVETIVLSLARGLAQRRDEKGEAEFDVTLATETPAGSFDDAQLPFPVIRSPRLRDLWRLIRAADVVHVAGPAVAPLFLAYLARKPLVIEHHGYQATCPNGLLFHHPSETVCPGHFEAANYLECLQCNGKIEGSAGSLLLIAKTFARGALSREAAVNIAPSHHVAKRQKLPRTTVIFHGVEDPLHGKEKAAEAPANDRKGFAYIGRLVVEKGVSVLLEATRLLCAEGWEIHVTLIGDGPDRPRLEQQIAAAHLEDAVRISGFLSGEAWNRKLEKTSAVVIPTIMEETAGLAALEQMVCGRPVIASAVGGLGEIVNGTGLTFPPNNPVALSDAMKRILEEPGLAASLGASARERVLRSFSFGGMIDAHACLYRAVQEATNR
jgi:glycosyltransferase involved in cell wall biosynthesis